MKKENKNLIKSYRELFRITGLPVFGTATLYMERTGETITLDGVGLDADQQVNVNV